MDDLVTEIHSELSVKLTRLAEAGGCEAEMLAGRMIAKAVSEPSE